MSLTLVENPESEATRILNVRPGGSLPTGQPLRVAFVHCPNPIYADNQDYGAKFMPVWAYTLASHLPNDGSLDLRLYDTRLEPIADVAEADVFLFTGINQDFGSLVKFQAELKGRYPKALTIVGGPICWSFHTAGDIAKLEMFDHVIIGDGEDLIGPMLASIAAGHQIDRVVNNSLRFKIADARPFYRPFLDETVGRYYGAVLEVSRGCPFLCEFCDIRILPDNNRAHNKSPELIVQELSHLWDLDVHQVLMACDNFISDLHWAEAVLDRIITWTKETGANPTLYTWLTINLYKHPKLLAKFRAAGFDMLFIGIESFSSNSLIETAKVQNTAKDLVRACQTIQSYGFIIVAGLIFGFDSDNEDCFEITRKGLLDSGLISGDPSLLTALPGTPLYRRIKESGRLREVRYGLGGYKYQTNIKYLMPRDTMIAGFQKFARDFTKGSYQYRRLLAFFDNLNSGNYIPLRAKAYGDPVRFAKLLLKNPAAIWQMCQRMYRFALRPANMFYGIKGFFLMLSRRRRIPNAYTYWQFWLFAWTNAVLKYAYIDESDFDLESVDASFDIRQVLPESYVSSADEAIPEAKRTAQQRVTMKQLRKLVATRSQTNVVAPVEAPTSIPPESHD